MPTLIRLAGSVITMYAADHQPPHFHVRIRDGREALVVIDDLSTITSSLKPRELLEAIEWAKQHTHVLVAKWQELNP